jgi:hypothetical protein
MDSETLAYAFASEHKILMANLGGITHDESLLCAGGCANGINWLAGHLLNARGRRIAAIIGAGGPFLTEDESQYYGRGTRPIRTGDPCVPLERLLEGLKASGVKITARLQTITEAELNVEIDRSLFAFPPDKPTVGKLVTFMLMHEMYHSGQIGLIRRALEKPSGIGV